MNCFPKIKSLLVVLTMCNTKELIWLRVFLAWKDWGGSGFKITGKVSVPLIFVSIGHP